MEKWYEKQCRLVQVLLLLIPVVNWIVEIGVRWSHYFRVKKHKLAKLILAILTIPLGVVFGWLDVIWSLLFKHLLFCN